MYNPLADIHHCEYTLIDIIEKGHDFIAERSEANNRDLWASESQLAFIHILRTSRFVSHASPAPGGKACVQYGASVVTRMPSSNS